MKFFQLIICGFFLSSCVNPIVVDPRPMAPIAKIVATAQVQPVALKMQSRASDASMTIVNKTLVWNANAEQVTSYNVYEVIAKTPTAPPHWSRIGTVTLPSFALNGLTVGSLHIYAVTAFNVIEGPKGFALIYRVIP